MAKILSSFQVFDFGNKVIMSGLIDPSVNICHGSELEDFRSITKAAAAGGYTTICDNPMFSIPATTSVKNLKVKISEARKNCLFVDCAFWGGVTNENSSELISLANHGVCGFKGILNTQESYPEFSHLSKKGLKDALEVLEEVDHVFAIKPFLEEPSYVPDDANVKEYNTLLAQLPPSNECNGVKIILDAIKNHKMKIHLTDISCSEVFPLIRKYQNSMTAKMSKISFETSYNYLALNSEEIDKTRTEFKCLPPIRSLMNQSKLWESMRNYEYFNVSSCHMPCSMKSKCLISGKNRGNFIEASNGIASLQYGLPIFWTSCQKNEMTIFDVNRFMSLYPAKLCGLDKNKGRIQVGFDADFCIWDPEAEFMVDRETTLFKNKISPYFGKLLKGRVHATCVRGWFVYDANNPKTNHEAMGNVLLKNPIYKSQRVAKFDDEDEN